MNAELIVQEHSQQKQLKQQIQDRATARIEAEEKKDYRQNIARLQVAIKSVNTTLRTVLKESPTIRQIFKDGDFCNVYFDKSIEEPHCGYNKHGYHIMIENKPCLIIPILPGSGEDMRPPIRIETPEDSDKWPMWALEYLKRVNTDLKSLTKEEIVRRVLVLRDEYPYFGLDKQ
jgi:hypothetical protein